MCACGCVSFLNWRQVGDPKKHVLLDVYTTQLTHFPTIDHSFLLFALVHICVKKHTRTHTYAHATYIYTDFLFYSPTIV